MAEFQHTNGGFIPPGITSAEPQETSAAVSAGLSAGSKRLRRPSVRLGDIGGEQYQHAAYDSQARRPKWRPEVNQSGKSSLRTRTLTNLSSVGYEDPISVGTWRVNKWVKSSGGETTAKRVGSNCSAKTEEPRYRTEQEDERFIDDEEEELEDGFRDFSREDSESPVKEQTETVENRRRRYESNSGRRGVRIWLQGLGLGRYWPMFEIHEVDEQVLPLLTLEDLKDIRINAVGSRRKMFCAIQKLGREFC